MCAARICVRSHGAFSRSGTRFSDVTSNPVSATEYGRCHVKLIHTVLAAALALASIASNAQGSGPSDPQIAAIVVTANQVDIDAGKLAETKTKSKDVKAFAQQI
ncbi:hypothetical protein OKW41_003898 [Paraburkholderia sp. UCT70]